MVLKKLLVGQAQSSVPVPRFLIRDDLVPARGGMTISAVSRESGLVAVYKYKGKMIGLRRDRVSFLTSSLFCSIPSDPDTAWLLGALTETAEVYQVDLGLAAERRLHTSTVRALAPGIEVAPERKGQKLHLLDELCSTRLLSASETGQHASSGAYRLLGLCGTVSLHLRVGTEGWRVSVGTM